MDSSNQTSSTGLDPNLAGLREDARFAYLIEEMKFENEATHQRLALAR